MQLSVDWPINQLATWFFSRLIDRGFIALPIGRTDGRTNERTDERTDGRTNERTDERTNERSDLHFFLTIWFTTGNLIFIMRHKLPSFG